MRYNARSYEKICSSDFTCSGGITKLAIKEKDYVISVKGGGKNREINLSSGTFKFGVVSVLLGSVLFVGACGYSVYSALYEQKNADSVTEVQKANEIQQEQLLKVSRKADAMNDTLNDLVRREEELRLQAGLKPPKPDPLNMEGVEVESEPVTAETPAEESKPTGQGGPIAELEIADVAEALDMIEQRVEIRKESLDAFQTELKELRDKWSKPVPAASSASSSYPGEVWLPQNTTPMPSFSRPAANSVPSTSSNIDWSKFTGNPSADSNTPSIWPATGVVTSPYGLRWGGSDFHPGMDIANDLGTPIVATADGTVEYAGWNSGGYGNMVDINHGNGIMTRYGHASQVVVSAGQSVKRGQVIAYMGSTGFSTGPHVHYEIHVNGQKVNPINYL